MKTIYHNFFMIFLLLFPYFIWGEDLTKATSFKTSFFQTKEGRVAYSQLGNGKRNLIFLPGIGDRKESYEGLATILSKNNSVYSFDLRGFGESDINFSSYGPKETAEDILEFIREKDLENVYIIANSMTAASAVYIRSKEKKEFWVWSCLDHLFAIKNQCLLE